MPYQTDVYVGEVIRNRKDVEGVLAVLARRPALPKGFIKCGVGSGRPPCIHSKVTERTLGDLDVPVPIGWGGKVYEGRVHLVMGGEDDGEGKLWDRVATDGAILGVQLTGRYEAKIVDRDWFGQPVWPLDLFELQTLVTTARVWWPKARLHLLETHY